MSSKNLLVELLVEELPPKALKKISDAFAQSLNTSLNNQGLLSDNSKLTHYASPRRLGAHITAVSEKAADKAVAQKLMPAAVGFDANGKPTPALLKKLVALGADESAVAGLKRENDGKTDVLFYHRLAKGTSLSVGLQKALDDALSQLPIPKVMSYQLADGWDTVNFVRPAHGLVALYGTEVLAVSVLGLEAGNSTQGHRFESSVDRIVIQNADSYETQMENEGAVIPSFAKRRGEIAHQLAAAAASVNLKPIEDDALLDEVTGLVERPNVLIGQFEESFLDVPQECLILTMKANQKYFPLLDAVGKLSNKFLIVSNINPADPSQVIGGNERVVRPRLADAKFFFDQDRKKTLASRVFGLAKVVYHNQLGTQGDRVQRVAAIARSICEQLKDPELAIPADRAALLAKADLLTDMVGEFPELQGIMGRYYALHDGALPDVADAIEDHYKPRFAGDSLPRNRIGMVVALADKLETLVGLFSIGQTPTGDKDPFALRRHALGIIRILIEGKLDLRVDELIAAAEKPFNGVQAEHRNALLGFIFDRLANALREQGYSAQEVDAVLSLRPQRLADVATRLAAVRAFAVLPEAPALAAANKRVGNILKKVDGTVAAHVDAALLKEAAETTLNATLAIVAPKADAAFQRGDYTASLLALAALKTPVDAFFDSVMVNVEDEKLRNNRLGLLATLHHAMNRVADLSKLAG
ncbi:MAG TPA: glycine--tRNA ligase subunit beta [Burkholderiales bacterium]|nr:glycine--tRNA ligase subunit beta [Burkholderiales bacterium]